MGFSRINMYFRTRIHVPITVRVRAAVSAAHDTIYYFVQIYNI